MTTMKKETVLDKIRDLSENSERFLAKFQEKLHQKFDELYRQVEEMQTDEATLFDPRQFDDLLKPVVREEPLPEPVVEGKARRRYTDGSANAQTVARQLSRELGVPITHKQVMVYAKDHGVEMWRSETEHNYRFPARSVEVISAFYHKLYGK